MPVALMMEIEAALKSGNRKGAVETSKLLPSVWRRAYQFLINEESIDGLVKIDYIQIPQVIPEILHGLHDSEGRELKNQSAKHGSQVDLSRKDGFLRDWLESFDERFIGVWTTRLPKGGFHVNHIHQRGLNSSVLYIEIPDRTSGHLQFGIPRFSDGEPIMTVVPEVGMLVSFPCCLSWGTAKACNSLRYPMRRRFVMRDGELIEVGLDYSPEPRADFHVMPDIKEYKSMITGETITSRAKHREHLKIHNCTEVGNDSSVLNARPKPLKSPKGLKETLIRVANQKLRY
jgi:hypothetical protein